MSYEDVEESVDEAAPVELYRISYGSSTWRYTSADEDQKRDGLTYSSAPIQRSGISVTQEVPRSSVNITVPVDLPPFYDFVSRRMAAGVVSVTIFRKHRGDDEFSTIWKGRVINIEYGEVTAEITTESSLQSLGRQGLKGQYHTGCRHALYDTGCKVNKEDHEYIAVVEEINGRSLVSEDFAEQDDGFWVAGYVRVTGGFFYLISSHSGDTIELQDAPTGLSEGDEVTVYPGCDHTLETCRDKFDNLDNYGGFPFIPGRSPFDGKAIYLR